MKPLIWDLFLKRDNLEDKARDCLEEEGKLFSGRVYDTDIDSPRCCYSGVCPSQRMDKPRVAYCILHYKGERDETL